MTEPTPIWADANGNRIEIGTRVATLDGIDMRLPSEGTGDPIQLRSGTGHGEGWQCIIADLDHGVVTALHPDGIIEVDDWAEASGPVRLRSEWMTATVDPDARVAGFDANKIWHDPGDGKFARPGWSSAKGEALALVKGLMARDRAKSHPDSPTLLRPDGDSLEKLGIPSGSAVQVRYLDDEFGIVNIRTDRATYPTKIRWDRFADPDPKLDAVSAPVAKPHMPAVDIVDGSEPKRALDEIGGADSFGPLGADLTKIDYSNKMLEHVDLSGAKMQNADLAGRSVQHSKLWSVDLSGANLAGTVFDDTILQSATLDRADAKGASFRGTDLAYTSLFQTKLAGADFTGARLVATDFHGADLTGASFGENVDVTGVDFTDATLNDVDLSGITDLDRATLTGAKYNASTRFPEGFDTSALVDTTTEPRMFDVAPAPTSPVSATDPAPAPSLFDVESVPKQTRKPTLPADTDAKLWEKRLSEMQLPTGYQRVGGDINATGRFQSVNITGANWREGNQVGLIQGKAYGIVDTETGRLVSMRGEGGPSQWSSKSAAEANAQYPSLDWASVEPTEPVKVSGRATKPLDTLPEGVDRVTFRSRDYLVHADGKVTTVDGKRVGAAVADKVRASHTTTVSTPMPDAPAAPSTNGIGPVTYRKRDYDVRPDGTVMLDGKRVGAAVAAKVRDAAGFKSTERVLTDELKSDFADLSANYPKALTDRDLANNPHLIDTAKAAIALLAGNQTRRGFMDDMARQFSPPDLTHARTRMSAAQAKGILNALRGEIDEVVADVAAPGESKFVADVTPSGLKVTERVSDNSIRFEGAGARTDISHMFTTDNGDVSFRLLNTAAGQSANPPEMVFVRGYTPEGKVSDRKRGVASLNFKGLDNRPSLYFDNDKSVVMYPRNGSGVYDPDEVRRWAIDELNSRKFLGGTDNAPGSRPAAAPLTTEARENLNLNAPWESGEMTVKWDNRTWRVKTDGSVWLAHNDKRVVDGSVIVDQVHRQATADANLAQPVDVNVPPAVAKKVDDAVAAEAVEALETDLEAPVLSPPEPENLPKGKFPPTAQQVNVLEKFATGESLVVKAGAGAGKTSTLVMIAEAAKADGRHGLFTAFNRAIVTDAGKKLKPLGNVDAATMHALANRSMRSARPELMKRLNSKALSRDAEAKLLGITDSVKTDERNLRPGWLAGWVMKGIERFAMSADSEPSVDHLEPIRGLTEDQNDAIAAAHLVALKRAWADLTSDDGKLRFGHSTYLKMFQLSKPNLNTSFILFDESQDASPVMADIITQQKEHGTQLVFVGDADQAINGFMGAVDSLSALEKVDGVNSTVLSKSFRFGPEVANIANNILARFSDARIEGAGKPSTIGEIADPDAILTRTNGTAMGYAINALEEGKTVAMSENLVKSLQGFARAAKDLQTKGWTDHSDLAPFSSWGAVQHYVEDDPAGEDIKTLVDLIDEHGADKLLDTLEDVRAPGDADLTVLTAHTSKGLEFPKVLLASDFPSDFSKMNTDDFRLMYVAATRAQERLDIGANEWILTPPSMPTSPRDETAPPLVRVFPTSEVVTATKSKVPDIVPLIPANEGPYAAFARKYPNNLTDSDVEKNPELRGFAKEALHTVDPGTSEFLSDMRAKFPAGGDGELSVKQARGVLNSLRRKIAENPAQFDDPTNSVAPKIDVKAPDVTPDLVGAAPDANDPTAPVIPDVPAPVGRGAKWNPDQIRAALRRINSSMTSLDIVNGKPVVATTATKMGDGRATVTRQPGIVDSNGVFHSAGPTETLTMKPRFGGADGLAKWYADQWKTDGVEQYEIGKPRTAAVDDEEVVNPVDPDQEPQHPGGALLLADRRPGTTSATRAHTAALVTEDGQPFNPRAGTPAMLAIDDEPVAVWLEGVTPTIGDVTEVVTHQGWQIVTQEAGDDGYDNLFAIDPLPPAERCRVAAVAAPGATGQWLVAGDNYLSRIGVRAGEAVQVRYEDDDHGVIDVEADDETRAYPVKWDRFTDGTITENTTLVTAPRRVSNNTKATVGAGSVTEERVRVAGFGHAIVADNYLARHDIVAGSVVPVTWVDSNTAMVASPQGHTVNASWSRFADTDPSNVTLDAMDIVNGAEFDRLPVGSRFGVEALGATVQTPEGRVAALVKSSDTGYTIAGEPAVEHEWNSTLAPHLRLLVEKDL